MAPPIFRRIPMHARSATTAAPRRDRSIVLMLSLLAFAMAGLLAVSMAVIGGLLGGGEGGASALPHPQPIIRDTNRDTNPSRRSDLPDDGWTPVPFDPTGPRPAPQRTACAR